LISVLLAVNYASATIIRVPDDCPTIQQGIDASFDGDTVLVKPGEYVGNINFNGKSIILASRFLLTGDTTYILDTIIDGDSSGTVVTIENDEDSTTAIIGFCIRNGYAYAGGGIYCENSGPKISNNIIQENIAHGLGPEMVGGGGIYCLNANSEIIENKIMGNRACYGGGIYCESSDATIKFNYIASNDADP